MIKITEHLLKYKDNPYLEVSDDSFERKFKINCTKTNGFIKSNSIRKRTPDTNIM